MASFRHGEADDFIFMIILVICAYDDVSKLKFIVGSFSFFTHDGGLEVLWRFFSDSIFSKVLLTISFVEGWFNFFTLRFKYLFTISPIIFVELSLVVQGRYIRRKTIFIFSFCIGLVTQLNGSALGVLKHHYITKRIHEL